MKGLGARGGFGEIWTVTPERAARPVAHVLGRARIPDTTASCVRGHEPRGAPRRRATFRQTLLPLLGLALALAGCGGGGKTVEVVSEAAPVKTVDLGPNGKSSGDTYVFDGALFDADEGHRVGHAYGMQTSIAVERDREVVQATITYTFDEGGSITIGGLGEYPLGDTGLIRSKPYERPIIGGTGKYAGASGTVTTVRRPDGRYQQTFHLDD